MRQFAFKDAEKYNKAHKRKKRWYQIMTFLAAVVVFCTTYALILPAITLETEQSVSEQESKGETELTEEEQAKVDKVIALIDSLPTSDEIEETAEDFEEAEDDDGLEDYLSGVYPQVNTAYAKYSALTDAQKAKVSNADKLMALEWIWSATTYADLPILNDDSARVTRIEINEIVDGTAPFDENDDSGNDSGNSNKIVRTFDTVTYRFTVEMESYTSTGYSEARVKLEFVLPLNKDEAIFDQTAMAWMDQTSGYAPKLTTETRSINGVDTECQVLTCYKRLLPSEGNSSVVPGSFGENVTVNVKSMKNGEKFAPILSAAMEYGAWDGVCSTHEGKQEKFTVQADEVTVSATPKYNIQIGGQSVYKNTFDFNSGNALAQAYGDSYGKGSVTGRVTKLGITIQLYNDNASKGFKGIELPDGSDITFDLKASSVYKINMPNAGSGYTKGQQVTVTDTYMPLLWSCDANIGTPYGKTNIDGRVFYDSHGNAQAAAPAANGGKNNSCYNSGSWTATQSGNTVHIKVSGYKIDMTKMPLYNDAHPEGDAAKYGEALGIGCFAAGEVWMVQPFNKIGETSDNAGPNFDIVQDYGQGAFSTTFEEMNLKVTSVSGTVFQDSTGTNDAQMVTNDDRSAYTLALTLPGTLQNRVAYLNLNYSYKGVGTDDQYDGKDFAAIGTEFRIRGGFSYSHQNEPDNLLYWGTNLTKFYGSAIEVIDTPPDPYIVEGANPKEWMVYYATKKDGKDWVSDDELQHTYEDNMVFYKNLSDIPEGHLCVGMLFCFKEDVYGEIGTPHYLLNPKVRVREDMSLAGKTFMLASTSRAWTKSFFESAGMTLDNIPDWSNPTTKLSSFPTTHYKSANIQGSIWYTKETYAEDGSGPLGTHNSDWQHWGDTLLVIGYKTGITKRLCQQSDGTDKTTFNMDADQRVVDFKLNPRTYFDTGATSGQSLSTTVTIVDTLPKHLTYRAGSSYFGGVYTQTSVNGGTQGSISGGTLREPDSITTNEDGTQTLTWIITDVQVGAEMPAIYYSANIGDRNNSENDVPLGTTNLLNKVRITATHDLRQVSTANGNYAEIGVVTTRGTASAYGKYSTNTVVEPDGEINYVIYYDNNSSGIVSDIVLLDTMPKSGYFDNDFTGTYTVKSWKMNNAKGNPGDFKFYYTFDEQYAGKTLYKTGDESGTGITATEIKTWTEGTIESDGTVTAMNGKTPIAWAIIGNVAYQKSVYIDLVIKLNPGELNGKNNVYHNKFSHGNLTSSTEEHSVVRTLEGLAWRDDNADGVQNEDSSRRISGVKVSLWKLREGTVFTNTSDDPRLYIKSNLYSDLTTETLSEIRVVASGLLPDMTAQLFYGIDGEDEKEENSIKATSTSTAEQEFVYDLQSAPNWARSPAGTVTLLRWNPGTQANLEVTLKSVTLCLKDGTSRVFDFTQTGAAAQYLYCQNVSDTVRVAGENEDDYVPYCYPGTSTQIVIETGKQISVLATGADKAKEYETGRYKFNDMPAGTFAVKFESGSYDISPYIGSPVDLGGNDSLDSDATAVYSADKLKLQKTVILGITMPKAEDMSVVLYESKYHDSGFYKRGYELPATGGIGTTPYILGGLVLIFGAVILLYKQKKRREEDVASS